MIQLRSSHIILPQEIVQQVFGEEYNIYFMYQAEKKQLLAVPVSATWFKNLYKNTKQVLLKLRNAQGDRSLAIGELIIDHDLDDSDRMLEYKIEGKPGLLEITLS